MPIPEGPGTLTTEGLRGFLNEELKKQMMESIDSNM